MSNAHRPPRGGRRITLGELLLSVFLLAMGMGMLRLTAAAFEYTTVALQNQYWYLGMAAYTLASFCLGAGVAIPLGRLLFRQRFRLTVVSLFGGSAGIAVGYLWPYFYIYFFPPTFRP